MRVIISGRHLGVTKAMKAYARAKVERLDRFHREIGTVRLTLTVEHGDCIAEVVVAAKRSTFVVSVQGGDMYASIDTLADKVERQLRRHKGKMSSRRAGKAKLKQKRSSEDKEEL